MRSTFARSDSFWAWLSDAHAAGTLLSMEKVGDELKAGGDQLSAWAEAQPSSLFAPMDAALLPSLAVVAQWTRAQSYRRLVSLPKSVKSSGRRGKAPENFTQKRRLTNGRESRPFFY